MLLVACGPRVLIESVDEKSKASVDGLIEDVHRLKSNAVGMGAPGVHVRSDAEWISEYNISHTACAYGVHQGNFIFLIPVGEWSTCVSKNGNITTASLSKKGAKLVLAHELGHYSGIVGHTESGLMAEYDNSCVDTVAQCLIEVLNAN